MYSATHGRSTSVTAWFVNKDFTVWLASLLALDLLTATLAGFFMLRNNSL